MAENELEFFQRFPSIEILADPFEPKYKMRYIECIKDSGSIRFEKREKSLDKSTVEEVLKRLV